ncbi:MAG TPA: signal peptide peptidase SppA [Rubrobacteraceae bacterium]|nr:signal peptide peptidase SppA [Rubrobacteraceae bacterium]
MLSYILDVLVNSWRFVRNVLAGLRRPPEYIAMEVGGSLPEFEQPVSFLRRRFFPVPTPISIERLRGRLDTISEDGRTTGILLRVRNLDASWAALEEARSELARFRERGGRVVVYLTDPDTRAYYLACAADEIYATPISTVNIVGLRTRVNFLRDALKQVGVEAEVVAVSPYKSAGDTFVRNDFSRESREQTERLLDRRFAELVSAVAGGRKMTPDEARERIDSAPHTAPEAVSQKLLDAACYEDELYDRLGAGDERANIEEWGAARKVLRVPYRERARKVVGLVRLSGAIVRGRSRRLPVPVPFLGGEQAGDESVVAALRAAEKSRRVAAIIFHVDSRGGDALASDLIWREIERIRAKKPVVVLMGEAAASGGYYVSAAASHIVARSNTITGSIGVIIIRPTTADLYGKLGVNPVAVERGEHAGFLDPSYRPTPEEISSLTGQLRFIYGEFKDRVGKGREMSVEDVEDIAGGRVWTGGEALERGLVDEIGGYRSALRRARELAEIGDDVPESVVRISPPRNVRPAPGEPAPAAIEALKQTFDLTRTTRIWAISPYETNGD